MKKEQIVEILDKHLRLMISNSIESFNDLEEMKKLPEYNACLNAMIEVAEAVKNNNVPTPGKLQLKGHDVKFIDKTVKIGNRTILLNDLEPFYHCVKLVNDLYADISAEDLYCFISDNKEKFGL